MGSIPVSRRSPGEGNGSSLQYFCLENSLDRGDWQAAVHGVAKSQTRLSDWHTHMTLSSRARENKAQNKLWWRLVASTTWRLVRTLFWSSECCWGQGCKWWCGLGIQAEQCALSMHGWAGPSPHHPLQRHRHGGTNWCSWSQTQFFPYTSFSWCLDPCLLLWLWN